MPEDKVPYEYPHHEIKFTQDDKVCPLRMINTYGQFLYPESTTSRPHLRCITEQCAWWMDYAEHNGLHCPPECALNRMAR